jgi:hypothetical protein
MRKHRPHGECVSVGKVRCARLVEGDGRVRRDSVLMLADEVVVKRDADLRCFCFTPKRSEGSRSYLGPIAHLESFGCQQRKASKPKAGVRRKRREASKQPSYAI